MRGPWGVRRAVAEPAETAPEEPDSASQYPCPSCGAIIAYAPGQTSLTCQFCSAESAIPAAPPEARRAAIREHDFEAALAREADAAPIETTQVVRCDACGGSVEFDPAEHARQCPFCATPIVADPAQDRHIRPQAVLPFAIDAKEASQTTRRWLGGLWFAPNGLKEYARHEGALSGIYTPWWTFDARTESGYSGQRGDAYSVRVRGPDGKPRMVTKIRWRPARGRVRRIFDDVTVLGSTSLPEQYVERVAQWDLSNLRPYSRDWLAGFRAEAYTVELRAAYAHARQRMDAVIHRDVRRAIGGDQQRIQHVDTRISDVTFKHVLLPIWIGAYKYRGKSYRIVVNGRSGEVSGERPYSVWKIALAVIAAALVLGAAALLVAADQGRF